MKKRKSRNNLANSETSVKIVSTTSLCRPYNNGVLGVHVRITPQFYNTNSSSSFHGSRHLEKNSSSTVREEDLDGPAVEVPEGVGDDGLRVDGHINRLIRDKCYCSGVRFLLSPFHFDGLIFLVSHLFRSPLDVYD